MRQRHPRPRREIRNPPPHRGLTGELGGAGRWNSKAQRLEEEGKSLKQRRGGGGSCQDAKFRNTMSRIRSIGPQAPDTAVGPRKLSIHLLPLCASASLRET